MAKDMLFNNYWTYIASGSGSQAEQTFTTLERLANDNIDSMLGSTGYIFKAEIEIKNAAGDGFSHSNNGFNYSLYNGSYTQTLNSNIDKKRGMRGNVIFDECGFLSDEMMSVYAAFAIVNKSFRSGKDRDGNRIDTVRLRTIPREIPNQLFYISSASDTSTKFYALYRDFSKKMIAGDKNYFVAHITCDVPLHPTIHGQLMAPLFEKSVIDSDMRTNPEKARREYYCEFTTDAGADAIIQRGVIARNEEVRKPLLYNDTGDKKFVIAYDPARSRDNSVILVGEIYDYEQKNGSFDKRMRIVNCINLVDVGKKIKSPMQTPDQIKYLKKVILDYNGGADAYGNIVGIYIDAGSGGGGVNIADYLMEDWVDEAGITHRGLIDKEYSAEYVKNFPYAVEQVKLIAPAAYTSEMFEAMIDVMNYSAEYVKKFPNAVDKVKLIAPAAYKSEMFEAMIELMNQNKISFTAPYDHKGYLTVFDVDEAALDKARREIGEKLKKQSKKMSEQEFERKMDEELEKIQSVKTKMIKLDWKDDIALTNIDALKEELVNMVRKKRESGKDSFELTPEKANKLHDDRAYTAALCSYALMCERRKSITNRRRPTTESLVKKLPIKRAKRFNDR